MRALFVGLLLPLFVAAAPPQVDWHFPMGAQRGTDLNASIGGKHNWPLQVWCEHDGVQFTATEKKGTFAVTVGKDVTPGPYLIRFHDANGTAPPRVFFVGKGPDITEAEPNNEMLEPQSI
ncbi:MAG TPA: hypothetical protein DEQ62_08380, partial [Verrucomicrobiales bacterium]|nr:hypothetical protein [Verrucomicrobiales bacterium]